MNRVLEPTTTELKKEIVNGQLLNRQFLFTKDDENLYIKYNDKLIPIGGTCKQNYLAPGDNIEIIRDGKAAFHLDGENGEVWISDTVDGEITIFYISKVPLDYCFAYVSVAGEIGIVVSREALELGDSWEEHYEYKLTVKNENFVTYKRVYVCLDVKPEVGSRVFVPKGDPAAFETCASFIYGCETVRLADDIDINTATLSPDGHNTLNWKGTIQIGELHNHNTIFLITKETNVLDETQGLLGGEIFIKFTKDDDDIVYGHYAITLTSTGSWSLKGASQTASQVRMIRAKWRDEWYYGLKIPDAVLYKLIESDEVYYEREDYQEEEEYTDTEEYEEEETYYETEIQEVITDYIDDFFIGMAVQTYGNTTTTHYDDRSWLALSNNSAGTAVRLQDTGIVPANAVSDLQHWQYCSFKSLMDLRGEELVDDGTGLYQIYQNDYYLYFNVYFKNTGGNESGATVDFAITDMYVCSTDGNYDPSTTPANVITHIGTADTDWFDFNETIKILNRSVETKTNTYQIYMYRNAMNSFYIRAGSNYTQLSATNMGSGYNYWYYCSLDTLLNNAGTTALGTLADFKDKGYYLYLYMYRRTTGTNYAFRITQVAITDRVMSATPTAGTTGVIANYGVNAPNWMQFDALVSNKEYATFTTNTTQSLLQFLDTYDDETFTTGVTLGTDDSSNISTYVHDFGDFKFKTIAQKEVQIEKTRTVTKTREVTKTRMVDKFRRLELTRHVLEYVKKWNIILNRSAEYTFYLTCEGKSTQIALTQATINNGYNYWYYCKLDDVLDLCDELSGDLGALANYRNKGYYLYLYIYRRNGTNYTCRITQWAITTAVMTEHPNSGVTNVVLNNGKNPTEWFEVNIEIVNNDSGYYYTLPIGSSVSLGLFVERGEKYEITTAKFKEAEFWFNGWRDIPDELFPKGFYDADISYTVLSDKSDDNDYFAETFYFGDASLVPPKVRELQETGEDNAPYKFIVQDKSLSLTELNAIADLCKDPEKQIYLDLSDCIVDSTAEEWTTPIFQGCVSLRGLKIPQGVKKITTTAFIWCTYMRELDLTPSSSTLVELGAADAWGTSIGFLTSTRVRYLLIPNKIATLKNYIVGSSNVKDLIFLHENLDPIELAQWSFMIFDTGGNIQQTIPDGYHVFVTKSWYNGYLSQTWISTGQYQWNNSSGWWVPNQVNNMVQYDPSWDQDEWQDFVERYPSWDEDLVNEVRAHFGYTEAIEIKS